MKIISFYSDTDGSQYYSTKGAELKARLDSLGIRNYHIEKLPSLGSYAANCLRKPNFIRDCYHKFAEPILWVDCDTDFLTVPCDIPSDTEIGAFRIPWVGASVFMHSFAVYFGKSERVARALDDWVSICEELSKKNQKVGDHGPLCDSIVKNGITPIWFPSRFAKLGMAPTVTVPSKRGVGDYKRVHTNPALENNLRYPVTIPLKGGLGNMMFQLATLETYSSENNLLPHYIGNGMSKKYEDTMFQRIPFSEKSPPNFFSLVHNPFHYEPIPKVSGATRIIGNSYFQSEKYLNRKVALSLFSPTSLQMESIGKVLPILKEECVSLHVRRGDYLTSPNRHPTLPISYYEEAVKLIGKERPILIFSDDLKWCEKNLGHLSDKIIFVYGLKDYEEIWAMSRCHSNIIANSTFSWWGAYLNETPNKVVICPKLWFGKELAHLNLKDIRPETWIQI